MAAKLVKTEAVVEGRTEVRWTLVEEGSLSASTFEMAAVSVVFPWST